MMKPFVIVTFLSLSVIQMTTCYKSRSLQARKRQDFDGMVELIGAVADIQTRLRLTCLSECFNNGKCLSFFYNERTGRCVIHSRDFIWQTPTTTEPGWNFYITKDVYSISVTQMFTSHAVVINERRPQTVISIRPIDNLYKQFIMSGRCPSPNYFYRHLDFCYNVNTITTIDSDQIKTSCMNKGGKVATITSQEFQEYFVRFLTERPHDRIFLGGTYEPNGKVKLDNGSFLTFYNWDSGQPDSIPSETCFELYYTNRWHNMECVYPYPAVYVCEL